MYHKIKTRIQQVLDNAKISSARLGARCTQGYDRFLEIDLASIHASGQNEA